MNQPARSLISTIVEACASMESDQQPIETEGTSTTLTEKTEDDHGEHQLEQAGGDTKTNNGDGEDTEGADAKTDTDTEKTATVNSRASTAKSALAKKEERLKRLRELHLRRVHWSNTY